MDKDRKKVTVVGSYNVGLFLKGSSFPGPGETVIGAEFKEGGGGKGSNQALAAAKLGAAVSFIGRIGDDEYGRYALRLYDEFGISKESVTIDGNTHSGVSVILIDDAGRNMIMVIPGANFRLSKPDIDRAVGLFRESCIVGFQLESNFEIVEYGINQAAAAGARVLLDPAPVRDLPEELFKRIWCIKPNEHEASAISGIKVTDYGSAVKAGRWFLDRGVSVALITLGSQGAVLVTREEETIFPAPAVKAIDTTGAGDCFSGAFMAALATGMEMHRAIRYANSAASISVTRLGVIEAIPTMRETLDLLESTEVKVFL
ncbi:MAG: ribokinase [Rectinemataceae bacterium]|jgi:ribokinase